MRSTLATWLRSWAQRLDPQPSATDLGNGEVRVNIPNASGPIKSLTLTSWRHPLDNNLPIYFNADSEDAVYDFEAR